MDPVCSQKPVEERLSQGCARADPPRHLTLLATSSLERDRLLQGGFGDGGKLAPASACTFLLVILDRVVRSPRLRLASMKMKSLKSSDLLRKRRVKFGSSLPSEPERRRLLPIPTSNHGFVFTYVILACEPPRHRRSRRLGYLASWSSRDRCWSLAADPRTRISTFFAILDSWIKGLEARTGWKC